MYIIVAVCLYYLQFGWIKKLLSDLDSVSLLYYSWKFIFCVYGGGCFYISHFTFFFLSIQNLPLCFDHKFRICECILLLNVIKSSSFMKRGWYVFFSNVYHKPYPKGDLKHVWMHVRVLVETIGSAKAMWNVPKVFVFDAGFCSFLVNNMQDQSGILFTYVWLYVIFKFMNWHVLSYINLKFLIFFFVPFTLWLTSQE